MSEKIIKKEESHNPKRECEIDLKAGTIIASLSESNEKQKEESK